MRGHVRPAKDKNGKIIRGAYDTVIDLGKDPITGKRKQKWKRIYGTRAEADAYVADRIRELRDGTYVEDTSVTLGEYALQWLEGKSGKRYRTQQGYESVVHRHIIPKIGYYRIRGVTAQVIKEFYADRRKTGRHDRKGNPTGEPLSESTVSGIHRVLNMILESARIERLIPRNPIEDIADLPQPSKPGSKAQFLTFEQTTHFLETAKNAGSRYYPLYFTALTTGMRAGELFGWRWSDIDFDANAARVIQTVEKPGPTPQWGQTKSNAGRPALLIEPLVEVLREWKRQQEQERELAGDDYVDLDLVFTTIRGTPIHLSNLHRRDFKPLLEKAGLPRIRFHDLRHSTATILLGWNVHPKIVQEILGHSQIQITQDIYSHAIPGLQRAAVEKWEEAFSPRGGITK